VVFLDADFTTLHSRLSGDEAKRPLLAGDLKSKLRLLLAVRNEHYNSFKLRVANISSSEEQQKSGLDRISRTPEETAWEIQKLLGCFHVGGMGSSYDVLVNNGGLSDIGSFMRDRSLNGSVILVCDENVAKLYLDGVLKSLSERGYTARLLVIPAGEAFKNLDTVAMMWKEFLEAGLDRKSTVVALGGGVVSDLAGFAASTYMRGCHWVVLPTTLLAMIDASLGGKTGFDLPEGKNLIGAFYPPRLVMADPDVLTTLPDEELRSGLAELVKHGIISDPGLFELCSQDYKVVISNLGLLIRRAMAVKIKIIQEDPFEAGIRAALNLGHTVGHAVEIASRFNLKHGQAVAIGMVIEARLAEKLGLVDSKNPLSERIKKVLTGLQLPTEIPASISKQDILQAMKVDKKKDNNIVRFALPIDIGKVQVGVTVNDLEMVI
jgi:3-dehydroquinate synthase